MGAADLVTVRREVMDHVVRSLGRLGVPGLSGGPEGPGGHGDRVPAGELVRLYDRAVEQSGDVCLGVKVARSAGEGRGSSTIVHASGGRVHDIPTTRADSSRQGGARTASPPVLPWA